MNEWTFIKMARQSSDLDSVISQAREKLDRQALVAFFKLLKKEFSQVSWYTTELKYHRRGSFVWEKLAIGLTQADCQGWVDSAFGVDYEGKEYRILSPDGVEVASGIAVYIPGEPVEMSARDVQSADRSTRWGAWRD